MLLGLGRAPPREVGYRGIPRIEREEEVSLTVVVERPRVRQSAAPPGVSPQRFVQPQQDRVVPCFDAGIRDEKARVGWSKRVAVDAVAPCSANEREPIE